MGEIPAQVSLCACLSPALIFGSSTQSYKADRCALAFIWHSNCLNMLPSCPLQMVKPRERNTRYVDAVMTVPKVGHEHVLAAPAHARVSSVCSAASCIHVS